MFEERRERKEEERAEQMQREQAKEAVAASETDDSTVDPNERLETEEEPLRGPRTRD